MEWLKKLLRRLRIKKIARNKYSWITLIAIFSLVLITARSCNNNDYVRKDYYIIARNTTWGSISLYGRDRNLSAFINDLMGEIAQEKEFNFSWIDSNSSSLVEGLDYDSYDAVAVIISPDPFFKNSYLYSVPLFNTGVVIVTKPGSTITSVKEIVGKTIGINSNSPLPFSKFKQEGANPLDVTFIKYNDVNRGFEAIINGTLDGFIVHDITAYTLIDSLYRGQLIVSTPTITDEGIRIITKKNAAGKVLVQDVDEALKTLKDNGRYAFLIKKWGLFDPEKPFQPK